MAESHRCLIFHRVMCRKCVACHENEPPCGISHLTVTLKQLSHDAIFCLHQGKEGAWLPRFGGTGQWSRLCLGHRVWEARKPTVISRCNGPVCLAADGRPDGGMLHAKRNEHGSLVHVRQIGA